MATRRAFTIIELIMILLGLVGIFLPALRNARGAARETMCMSNMRQLSVAAMTYSVDFRDRFATFSWTPEFIDGTVEDHPELKGKAKNDMEAAAMQAAILIRSQGRDPEFKAPDGWQPHASWSTLMLLDYLAERTPSAMLVCRDDKVRQDWLLGHGEPGRPDAPNAAWKYSSSYTLVPAVYTPNQFTDDGGSMRQGADHFTVIYSPGDSKKYRLKGRFMSHVVFPSGKAQWHEDVAWHTPGGARFFADPAARTNVAFIDGHIAAQLTSEANNGGYALADGTVERTKVVYTPRAFLGEPARGPIAGDGVLTGRYHWTQLGLAGVDVGAPEPMPTPLPKAGGNP